MRNAKKLVFAILFLIYIYPATLCHCQELVFSTHPFANPVTIHKRFQPLISYLSEKTGIQITLRIAPNYLAHVKAMGTGKADLGFAGPSPYVRVKDKYGGIDLLARFKVEADKNDKVVFVCKEQSSYMKIKDLKGKSFAFGDHQSFGSHFMPRWLLQQNGLSLHDLTAYDFVKSHDNVILSVLHGDFDAGGVRQDVFEKYIGRPLRIFAGPYAIPPHVLVCRSSLDKSTKKILKKSLLALKDRSVLDLIDQDLTGFESVKDGDFNLARKIMRVVESL